LVKIEDEAFNKQITYEPPKKESDLLGISCDGAHIPHRRRLERMLNRRYL